MLYDTVYKNIILQIEETCLYIKYIIYIWLLHHLLFKYKVEKYIAIKSCEITKFYKLWEN